MRWLTAAALVTAVLVAGCGSGDGSSGAMVRTGAVPTRTTPDKRLLTEPAPLSLADVARYPAGSAQRTVMQLLFWAQWGNFPAVVDTYDSLVVTRLRLSRITASYAWLVPAIVASRPRLAGYRHVGRNAFVAVELLTTQYPPTRDSFLLRPRSGGWKIVWDTLLARSLAGYTIAHVAADPTAPSPRARRLGEAAAQAYRDIYPSLSSVATRKPLGP